MFSGGGFSLALAADVRIAGESFKGNAAFIKIGLSGAELGSSYFLPRIVSFFLPSSSLLSLFQRPDDLSFFSNA